MEEMYKYSIKITMKANINLIYFVVLMLRDYEGSKLKKIESTMGLGLFRKSNG